RVGKGDAVFESPYKNTRPGVEYVGDAACARCHAEIAESYHQHPMGRSLIAVGSGPSGEAERASFEAQGFHYPVERRGDRVIHEETRRDAQGRVIARNRGEARFAVGSGARGRTYLIDRDGYLFESPISWYSEGPRWDLSPGYRKGNAHF